MLHHPSRRMDRQLYPQPLTVYMPSGRDYAFFAGVHAAALVTAQCNENGCTPRPQKRDFAPGAGALYGVAGDSTRVAHPGEVSPGTPMLLGSGLQSAPA